MHLNSTDMARARLAIKQAVREHLFDPNVNLIDIGYRIQSGNRLVPEVAIRFHLHTKLQGPAFESFADAQPERVIPSLVGGFPTDVIQSSYHLSLVAAPTRQPQLQLLGNPRASVMNPMQGGISISDSFSGGYGTLGGLVYDRETGDEMILSNYHVLSGSPMVRPGSPILQPGRGDGGRQTVATFVRHGMNAGIDAAVARLNGRRTLTHTQYQLGAPTGVTEPTLGMRLVKSGRASGITRGMVTAIEGVVKIRYRMGERLIRRVCHIVPVSNGLQASAPGDSGSFWLNADTNEAVGLHFAGADQPEYALAINMAAVESALNVDVVID